MTFQPKPLNKGRLPKGATKFYERAKVERLPHRNKVASIFFVYEHGGELHMNLHDNHACHAGLNSLSFRIYDDKGLKESLMVEKGNVKYIFDSIQTPRTVDPEECYIAFLDYLLNRSFWRHAFIVRDVQRIWKDKLLVIDPDMPGDYVAAACCAGRYLSENSKVLKTWTRLVKEGFTELEALMAAHCVKYGSHGGIEYFLPTEISAHAAWSHHATDELIEARKVVDADPIKALNKVYKPKDSYNESQRYRCISGCALEACLGRDKRKYIEAAYTWEADALLDRDDLVLSKALLPEDAFYGNFGKTPMTNNWVDVFRLIRYNDALPIIRKRFCKPMKEIK